MSLIPITRKPVLAYVRCSTIYQTENNKEGFNKFGLDMQKDAIEKYCQVYNYDIVDWYIDEGVSGSFRNRPELNRLLSNLRRGDLVLTYDITRLMRNAPEFYKLIQEIEAKGA